MTSKDYKRIVVKIGSNVLTRKNGFLDENRISHLVKQIDYLVNENIEVILISSGAVASGRELVELTSEIDQVIQRQIFASTGQVKLISTWTKHFKSKNKVCAQVLVTKGDFRDRKHYLNMKNCLIGQLQNRIIPIVNENDVVAITELMFTDNDELAGLVATMIDADALIILTNVDGVYDGNPRDGNAKVIKEVIPDELDFKKIITSSKSEFGRGGMLTKYHISEKTAKLGINVHIANGKKDRVLEKLINMSINNTHFLPFKPVSAKKKWIAFADQSSRGQVTINEGAYQALSGNACSLLPVGIMRIDNEFQKGDIIKIATENKVIVGYGIAEYSSANASDKIGKKGQRILIHYNYLHLN